MFKYEGTQHSHTQPLTPTGSARGPLHPDWLTRLRNGTNYSRTPTSDHQGRQAHMCVYVLIKADFDLPLQALRTKAQELLAVHVTKVMVELHRSTYVWLPHYQHLLWAPLVSVCDGITSNTHILSHTHRPTPPPPLLNTHTTATNLAGSGPQTQQTRVGLRGLKDRLASRLTAKL